MIEKKIIPKSKRIFTDKWVKPFIKRGNSYISEPQGYRQITSEHGRSQAVTRCGFCDQHDVVYIFSFVGGGKKCRRCHSIMFPGGAIAEIDRTHHLEGEVLLLLKSPDQSQ